MLGWLILSVVLGCALGIYFAYDRRHRFSAEMLGAIVLGCAAFGFVMVPTVALMLCCECVGRALQWIFDKVTP